MAYGNAKSPRTLDASTLDAFEDGRQVGVLSGT